MNSVYPQPGYGQPAYNPYPPPMPMAPPPPPVQQAPISMSNNQTIIQAPAPAAPTIVMAGGGGNSSGEQARFSAGSCTRCGGDIGPGPFTTNGILCAICCFPCGILCCLKWKNKKCNSCGRVYKS